MKIKKESEFSLKRILYVFAGVLLLVVGMQNKVLAYTVSTSLANLNTTELQTNLNNKNSADADVLSHGKYAGVQHSSSEWNHLGRSNTANDGVAWSVNGAAFGNNPILATGAFNIQFEITLWSAGYGRHDYDQAKAWVDWNNDGIFTNDNLKNPTTPGSGYIANETILAGQYYKKDSDDSYKRGLPELQNYGQSSDQIVPDPTTVGAKINQNNVADTMTTFITQSFTVTEAMLNSLTLGKYDGFWLRARAQCNHVLYNNMDPYTLLAQGEAEDHFITIGRAPVPEPTTMLLFGAGMAVLAVGRRRSKKKEFC